MASIVKVKSKTGGFLHHIRFRKDGKQQTLRLGKSSRQQAQAILPHVEALIRAQKLNQPAPAATEDWLNELGDELLGKIVKLGLTTPESDKSLTLDQLHATYLRRRKGKVTEVTLNNDHYSLQSIIKILKAQGVNRTDQLTIRAFNDLRDEMVRTMSPLSAATRLRMFRQALRYLAEKEEIGFIETPRDLSKINASRKAPFEFIPFSYAEKLANALQKAGKPHVAMCVMLARGCGLRCPSETRVLRTSDIITDRHRGTHDLPAFLRVTNVKTGERTGRKHREVPVFLRTWAWVWAYRSRYHGIAKPEATVKIPNDPSDSPSVETFSVAEDREYWQRPENDKPFIVDEAVRECRVKTLTHFIPAEFLRKNGLKVHTRLFQNLRASCANDFYRIQGLDETVLTVTAWMGHTPTVGYKHYLEANAGSAERMDKLQDPYR